MNKKLLISILISALAVGILLYQFDIREFARIRDLWNPYFILPMILSNIWAMVFFGFRWYHLLEKKISFPKAVLSSFLGVGANMVLPARGGDLLRVYYCKSESDTSYPFIISRLFIEKILDLTIVLFIGAISFLLLGLGEKNSHPGGIFISGAIVVGLIAGLIILRYGHATVIEWGSIIFGWIGKREFFEKNIAHHIQELVGFLNWRKLGIPVLVTIPTWLLGYAITYLFQSHLVGIPLEYTTVLFMVFCGAMGVALPSAPSGVGIFHASIISGFILLGLGSKDGFLYATAVHLMQFAILSLSGLVAYLVWMSRKRGEMK